MGGNHVYSLSYVCLPGWEDRRGLFCRPGSRPCPGGLRGPSGGLPLPGHPLRHHHHAGWLCRRPGPPPAPAGGAPGQGGLCEPPGPADGPVCGLGGPQGVSGLFRAGAGAEGPPRRPCDPGGDGAGGPGLPGLPAAGGGVLPLCRKGAAGLPPAAGEAGGPVRGPAADGGRRRGGELVLPPSRMRGRGEPGGGPRGGRVHHRRVSFERGGFLPNHGPVALSLAEAKPLAGDGLWLRYTARGKERTAP